MTSREIQEQTVQLDDVDLHVATAGVPSSPPLLLLHGLYDRWESWGSVVRAFAPHYHVLAPDLRGHARSSKPQSNYDPQDYTRDLIGLLDQMNVDQVVVIGHSLGALVGQFLAVDAPERVRALVMVDPPFEQTDGTRAWLEILLDAKRGDVTHTYETVKELNILQGDEREWRRQTDWLRETADGPFEAMITMIDDGRAAQLYEVLRRVTCPTLLLQADPSNGGALSDAGANLALEHLQNGTHRKVDDTGHSIHIERPDEFVEIVTGFASDVFQATE